MIYIISSKKSAVLKRGLALNKKKSGIELLTQLPEGYKTLSGDQIYLDMSGLTAEDFKKLSGRLKKSGVFWGIIDPKGSAMDPASFLFKGGAGDYIGPNLVKKGVGKKRFEKALSYSGLVKAGAGTAAKEAVKKSKTAKKTKKVLKRKIQKLPAGKFKGWRSIRTGTTGYYFFLFVSLSGEARLRALLGEASFTTVKNRLRDVLLQNFTEADALLWMETEGSTLVLIPPKLSNGITAVETTMKMILSSRLIGIEKLGLTIPVDFTFALHYGQTIFQTPGKTGGVISESVNYIFHLGKKKAKTGRLTISGDVPVEVIPEGLADLFVPAGAFEGIPIWQSKKFIYS